MARRRDMRRFGAGPCSSPPSAPRCTRLAPQGCRDAAFMLDDGLSFMHIAISGSGYG